MRQSPRRRRSGRHPFLLDLRRADYHGREVSPHVTNALLHLGMARQAVRRRDPARASAQYREALRSWERANGVERGRWAEELDLVRLERDEALQGVGKTGVGDGGGEGM